MPKASQSPNLQLWYQSHPPTIWNWENIFELIWDLGLQIFSNQQIMYWWHQIGELLWVSIIFRLYQALGWIGAKEGRKDKWRESILEVNLFKLSRERLKPPELAKEGLKGQITKTLRQDITFYIFGWKEKRKDTTSDFRKPQFPFGRKFKQNRGEWKMLS